LSGRGRLVMGTHVVYLHPSSRSIYGYCDHSPGSKFFVRLRNRLVVVVDREDTLTTAVERVL
jgi:hypothetical protein